jgi:transcriptional regulator with XRE-family HTH domain
MTDDASAMTGTTQRRATRAARAGRSRAGYVAGRLGTALRDARLAHGMRQRDVAEHAGVSQPQVAKLERAGGSNTALAVWAACGAAVGLQLAAFFEATPGADLPRDIAHLRRQNLVVVTATPGGWSGEPEAALPGLGSRPQSIDVLLTREVRREAAVVEIWDLLLDGGEAMRSLEAKALAVQARLGPDWHVEGVLVVRGTHRNRRLIGELAALFAARYPASSHAWLRCLADPGSPMPRGSGFVWTDVNGTRLLASRLRPRR